MTKEELKDKFKHLYDYMSVSNEPKYMMLFGDVMKEMFMWMADNKPELAEKMVEKLCSIKWKQYLTKEEATDIVKGMVPAAPWDYDTWHNAMKSFGLECERESVFNSYACWVAMNQIYTDFGETLAKALGKPLKDIPAETLVPIVYEMALDLLEDKDKRYDIRSYHLSEK